MKMPLHSVPIHRPAASRRGQRGTAVMVVLFCLAIVFAYLAINARTLHYLGRELRLIERQQTRRLAAPPPQVKGRSAGQPPQAPMPVPSGTGRETKK